MERKASMVDRIQRYVDEYERVFVFSYENMRTAPFKELRVRWAADSQ